MSNQYATHLKLIEYWMSTVFEKKFVRAYNVNMRLEFKLHFCSAEREILHLKNEENIFFFAFVCLEYTLNTWQLNWKIADSQWSVLTAGNPVIDH